MPVIILETGYNQETAEKLLKRFVDYGKILYNVKTREIGIINWLKFNPMESPKVRTCVEKELKEVKDKTMIGKIYPGRYPIQGVLFLAILSFFYLFLSIQIFYRTM